MHQLHRRLGLAVWLALPFAALVACDTSEQPANTDTSAAAADREVIFVTGSTGGLGREVALHLASPDRHIIVHGRGAESAVEVVDEIEALGGSASYHLADFASFDQVRDLAAAVLSEYDRLDVLVNNAGVWLQPEDGRWESDDGHEFTFQVNYLSHFLLTHLLMDRIVDSAPARIVNVASAAQQPIDFDNVMLEREYSDGRAYAQSKLAQILMTIDMAEQLEGTGVLVTSLHPATMMDTGMVLGRGAEARSSVDEGTAAVANLVVSDDVESGSYYNGQREVRAHDQAYDEEARERLRNLAAELTGVGP